MAFASFLSAIKGKKVLLLTHAGCDVDALAAAGALALALKNTCQPTIGIPEHINLGAKELAKNLGLRFQLNPSPERFHALMLVDLNSFDLLGRLEKDVKKFQGPIFLLDHHTKSGEKLAKPEWTLIRENAVSSTELVYGLIKSNKLLFDKRIATLIACGIITDSAGFLTAVPQTFTIMAEVTRESGKSFSELLGLFSIPQDVSEKIAKLKAAKRLRIFKAGPFLLGFSEVGSFEAGAASMLVKIGLDVAFVGNQENGLLRISGRAGHYFVKKNKFDLARHVFQPLSQFVAGTGGGHSGAAAFSARTNQPVSKALKQCVKLAFEFLRQRKPALELKEYS